jgi:hypothetical protein
VEAAVEFLAEAAEVEASSAVSAPNQGNEAPLTTAIITA